MNNNNNKSQFLSTREAIIKWLDRHKIEHYSINDDLSVDVESGVDISCKNLKFIPVKFGEVSRYFWCYDNKLTSLVGSPESVGGFFDCENNKLTNLASSPKHIKNQFFCRNNSLSSLSEMINCDFNGTMYFNIDIENFKPKELIQTLKKYYSETYSCYVLSNNEFLDTIKPQIQKEVLQQKLNTPKTNTKAKANFI